MFLKESYFTLKENFLLVFSKKTYLIFSVGIFILMTLLFELFTDAALIRGNLGEIYFYVNYGAQLIIAFLFSLFLPLSLYKIISFSEFSVRENSSSFFGSFLGILVAGCPACSVSLASIIGLAGLVSFLPWHGLELKILGLCFLLYALYSTLLNLQVCALKKKRKNGKTGI